MNTDQDDDSDYTVALIRGDPLFRLQRAVGLIPRHGLGLVRRAVLAAMFTWLPIVVWAWWRGHIFGSTLDEPLLQHYGVHVRCLVAIPLLIIADGVANAVSLRLLPQFVRAGIVADDDKFHQVVRDMARLRDRTLPWVFIAGIVVTWLYLQPLAQQAHDLKWAVDPPASGSMGFGGWWYLYVARPVYVTLILAWVWRIVLLTVLMVRVSRLPLSLVPTHPDRQAGLGFLTAVPGAFSLVILALSSVLASGWAHNVMFHEVTLNSLRLPAAGFVVIVLIVFLAPLLVFTPALARTRRFAKLEYSALVARHGRAVRERWINGQPVVDAQPLLEAPEIGPVADTISMYDAVARISPLPVGRTSLLAVLIPAIIPMIVVVTLRIPIRDMVLSLLKALT